jgi:hypothetical protein
MVETSDFQNAQIFNMSNQDAILNMNKSPNSTAYVTAWGKLYKKTIFDSIRFPKGKFHEDEFTTYKTFYVSQRITFIDYPLYYYFFRQNSIMNSENYQKKVDLFEALIGRSTFFENNKILFNSSIERCFYAYINIRTHLKCAYKRKLKPLINEFFNLEHSNNISKKNKKEFLIWKYFAFLGIINYYFNRLIIRSKDFFRKG